MSIAMVRKLLIELVIEYLYRNGHDIVIKNVKEMVTKNVMEWSQFL